MINWLYFIKIAPFVQENQKSMLCGFFVNNPFDINGGKNDIVGQPYFSVNRSVALRSIS